MDWQNTTDQVTACGAPGSSDPSNYTVDHNTKDHAHRSIAKVIDNFIRAMLFDDGGARGYLLAQASNANGVSAGTPGANADYALQLKPECFGGK